MGMLEGLPTVEEMIAALNSPVVPETAKREDDIQMSTEEMIREMFHMMKVHGSSSNTSISMGGVRARDTTYNSSTDTYNGLPITSQYNGGSI